MIKNDVTFTERQLENLERDELLNHCILIQSSYKAVTQENKILKQSLDSLHKKFDKLNSVVEGLLESQNKSVSQSNIDDKRFYDLERRCYATEQYSRRDTLEFIGIDESVLDKDLEKKVCNILEDIDVNVNEREIQACHRLGDGKRTIVKFVNRKSVFDVLSSRKKLANIAEYKKKMFINESLCPYYRFIHGKCKALWKLEKIFGFWVSNGTVRYRLREHGNFCKVTHINDLIEVFGELPN